MERKNVTMKNLQTKQPFIEVKDAVDSWPEPLVDASSPVTYKYTTGKSGTVESRKVNNIENEKIDTEKDEG